MDAFQIIVSALFFLVTSGMMFTLRKMWGRIDANEVNIQEVRSNYLNRFEDIKKDIAELKVDILDRISRVKDDLTDTKLFSRIIKDTVIQTLNRIKKR